MEEIAYENTVVIAFKDGSTTEARAVAYKPRTIIKNDRFLGVCYTRITCLDDVLEGDIVGRDADNALRSAIRGIEISLNHYQKKYTGKTYKKPGKNKTIRDHVSALLKILGIAKH